MLTNEELAHIKRTCGGRVTTDPRFAEFYKCVTTAVDELLTLREATAPQMAEVDAFLEKWRGPGPWESEAVEEALTELADLARTAILACGQQKRRADEAEKIIRELKDNFGEMEVGA